MKKWGFSIASIFLMVLDLVFPVLVVVSNSNSGYTGVGYGILIISGIVASLLAIYCLHKSFPNKYLIQGITARMTTILIISYLLTTALYYTYWQFYPKYSRDDAYKMIKKDPAYASELVVVPSPLYGYRIEGNPFERFGYVLFLDTIEYKARSFKLKTSEIQFNQITGEYRIGHVEDTTIVIDSIEKYSMDCVFFYKDRTAQIYLHFMPKHIYYGYEFSSSYHAFNASYDEIVKAGINITTRQRPKLDEDDIEAFIHDIGEDKLRKQLEQSIQVFIKNMNDTYSTTGCGPADYDFPIKIKLYGVELATYKNGELVLAKQ